MNFVFCFLSRLPHGTTHGYGTFFTATIYFFLYYVDRDKKYTVENYLPTCVPQRILSNDLPSEVYTECIFNGVDGKTYRCSGIVGNNDDLNH